MGNYFTLTNQTPYSFTYCYHYTHLVPGTLQGGDVIEYGKKREVTQLAVPSTLYVKYGTHNIATCRANSDLTITYNGIYNPKFYIRLAGQKREKLQLVYEGTRDVTCPNHAQLEDVAIRKQREDEYKKAAQARRQMEEQRRREEALEIKNSIREKLKEEHTALKEELSKVSEQMKAVQSGQEKHHQRSEVLYYFLAEFTIEPETEEQVEEAQKKFQALLNEYNIQEDPSMVSSDIKKRIETLQYHLILHYFKKMNLPIWGLRSLDKALSYQRLSLAEALSFLEAVVQMTIMQNGQDTMTALTRGKKLTVDAKSSCIIPILDILYNRNKDLAWKFSKAIFSELSSTNQDYLCHILFNGIWSLTDAVIFCIRALAERTPEERVNYILRYALTHHINSIISITILQMDLPAALPSFQKYFYSGFLKPVRTILNEMRAHKFPVQIMSVLEPVLDRMAAWLPQYYTSSTNMDVLKKEMNDGKTWAKNLTFTSPDKENLIKILIGISIAIEDVTTITTDSGEKLEGYLPTLTQLAAVLTLLLSKTSENNGCLLEIPTGEGKSTIVAILALIFAVQGKKVDVITSNPILARRDKEDWEKLYKMFGVSCSVIPPSGLEECTNSQQIEKAIKEAYKADIIYSTVSNCAADILRQEFEKKTTRGDRPFDVAIVDEVDYMTIDSGVEVTYLSHAATGMKHLEPVLAAIWAKVCTCRQIEDAQTGEWVWTTGAQYFHKAAAAAVMGSETSENFNPQDILMPGLQLGFLTQEDVQRLESKINDPKQESQDSAIKEIMNKLEPPEQRDLLTVFQTVLKDSVVFKCYKVQDGRAVSCGTDSKVTRDNMIRMLLLEHGLACIMISEEDLITATVDQIKSRIRFSSNYIPPRREEKTEENFLVLPVYLQEYTNNKLRIFVENSLKAILMLKDREYIIESVIDPGKDKAVTDKRQYDGIIPVDFRATGILEKNKRWGDGLQQFLEMKHQLAISPLTNVTNFMSNFHFFQRYTKGTGLFGVSGTLGDEAEIDFLRKHFKTSCFSIPTHRYTKRVELSPVQVEGGRDAWIKKICEYVKEKTSEKKDVKGLAGLVVCEDVRTANELQQKLLQYNAVPSAEKVTMYTRSDKHNVENRKFNSGDVIIATNLGGRGTDFNIDKTVNTCGGLYVLLTYFPKSRRTEKQIYGRTARKGNPGMVQMVLNYEDLEPKYQGQAIDIMKDLRADHERSRIVGMEKDELLEVGVREELFKYFCIHLQEFSKNYSEADKIDIFTCTNKQLLSTVFGSYKRLIDYRIALNALKESWALWLTLHEKTIDKKADLQQLKNGLQRELDKKNNDILSGKSTNFYDFIKLAMDRMYLHTLDKSSDYGALKYWENAEMVDPVYRAISRYNSAYITVNLRKTGYIKNAINFLNDTRNAIDIYISEQTNTTVACQLSCIAQFEPHYKEEPNFTKQMQTRMSLFKSWIDYIDKSINMLSDYQKNNEDAVTEDVSIFSLSDRYDYITTNELTTMYDMGLSFVFEVKRKPRFCIDALVCAILGALQILAGILVCALSFGTATQFGMGLIAEGVTDIIAGIVGMVMGSFSWAEWAIAKAISIGLSLVTAGFSVIQKAVTTVQNATRGLLTGAESFKTLAYNSIQSGKIIFTSAKRTLTKQLSAATTQSLSQSMKTLSSNLAVRNNFKQAAKYAGKESVQKVATTAFEIAVDEGLQAAFRLIFSKALHDVIEKAIQDNETVKKTIAKFIIIYSVPEGVLATVNLKGFKIASAQKNNMKTTVEEVCTNAVADVTNDFEFINDIVAKLQPLGSYAVTMMENAKVKKSILQPVKFGTEIMNNFGNLMNIINAIPTKNTINNRVVPFMVKETNAFPNADAYKEPDWSQLGEIIKVRDELVKATIDKLSEEFTALFAGRLTIIVGQIVNRTLGEHVTNTVRKMVGSQKTEQFFADQTHRQEMKKLKPGEGTQTLTESEKNDFDKYVKKLQNENRSATDLDLNILTKSDVLQGKGIRIIMVDEKGKQLSTETYPGKDSSAGTITLQLTKVKEQTGSEKFWDENPYSGNFRLLGSDGKPITANTNNPNSLYVNLAVAAGAKDDKAIKTQAQELQSKVHKEISQKSDHYQSLIIMQMEYEKVYESPGKYTIQGTALSSEVPASQPSRKRRDLDAQKTSNPIQSKIDECLQRLMPAELMTVLELGLGMVSKDHRLPGGDYHFQVVQNPVPPMSLLELGLEKIPPGKLTMLEKMKKMELFVTALSDHYWSALSNRWEIASTTIRSSIMEQLVNMNWEKALKLSFISTHPLASENLREDAGLESVASWRWDPEAMSEEGMNIYYQIGFYRIVHKYNELNVLDEGKMLSLFAWIETGEYLKKTTPEYTEILKSIKSVQGEKKAP